jgi:pimeloyl-ACP methyl ester carboxylesterase
VPPETQVFRDIFYSARDGLRLHARVYGPDTRDAPTVICLPGLTRNARDFHELALILTADPARPRRVISFDYRGRGESDRDPDWRNYQVPVEADDVTAGLTALDIDHAVIIGTSRGGLITFALAAQRPGAIAGVVLNDIGPVLEGAGLAQIRATLDRAPKAATFDEAVAYQKAAHGTAFSALSEEDWRRFTANLMREENGRLAADYDPALLKTLHGIDFSQPLPVYWPQFHGLTGVPMLAIRGANSKLLSAQTLEEMVARHPRCETITVEGQGHPPLLETGTLPRSIAAFIDRVFGRRARN